MTILFIFIIIIYLAIAIYFALLNSYKTVGFFLIADCLQNIVAIVFYNNGVDGTLITAFTMIKELMIYLAVIVYLFKRKKIHIGRVELLALFYIAIVAFNFLRSSAPMSAIIASVRTLLLPVVFICYGKTLPRGEITDFKVTNYIIKTSLILSVFAFIEYFILGDAFWRSIGYTKYITSYKIMSSWTYNGVSINYYTWDFGHAVRRFVSLMADPLATAYLVFLGLSLLWLGCKNKLRNNRGLRHVLEIFLLITSILFFSKGIYVCITVCLMVAYLFKNQYRYKRLKTPITIGLFIILAGVMYVGFSGKLGTTSSANHFNGLVTALQNGGWFGRGLGSAGINAAVSGAEVDMGESYIGTIIYQLGYIGLLLFGFMYAEILKKSITIWRTSKENSAKHSIYILIAIFLCMMFSESSCSVSGTGIYFILIGMTLRKQQLLKCD